MDHLIFTPHPALQPFIRHYVYIEIGEKKKWERSNLAPTGCTVLSFALEKEQVFFKEDNQPAASFKPLAFTGQAVRFKPFNFYDRLKNLMVIFKPCGAYSLLGIRSDMCTDFCMNLSDMIGASMDLLTEKLSEQKLLENAVLVMEKFFLLQLHGDKKISRIEQLALALEEIEQHSYMNNVITTACRKYGYTISSLERHTREFVGLTPKQFQRIARFNTALEYIESHQYQCNWAQLAYQFGYYDQSHFIKDFKLFYGKTPNISSCSDTFISKIAFRTAKAECA